MCLAQAATLKPSPTCCIRPAALSPFRQPCLPCAAACPNPGMRRADQTTAGPNSTPPRLPSRTPRRLNTLRPCAAEVSYLFFLSCLRETSHSSHSRGSRAFQQSDAPPDREVETQRGPIVALDTPSFFSYPPLPPLPPPLPPSSVLFTLQQLASTSLLLPL